MKTNLIHISTILACASLTSPADEWSATEADGKFEGRFGGELQASWQRDLTVNPPGGDAFRSSAFLHPLTTPSGFVWTQGQPGDHPHHAGLWWPWKFVEVEGQSYVTWEIQQGQGAHVARDVRVIHDGPDYLQWEFHNETVIRKPGDDAGPPVTDGIPVIREVAHVRLSREGDDANVFDVVLKQEAIIDTPVSLPTNHYSGFSWRGPHSWNANTSTLITSEGHDRSNANGQPARWLLITGPTDDGEATVLIMSAAADIADAPEHLRIWDPSMYGGVPFINFNPVAKEKLTLNEDTPAAANRQYRVIAADRVITADEAEKTWRDWRDK